MDKHPQQSFNLEKWEIKYSYFLQLRHAATHSSTIKFLVPFDCTKIPIVLRMFASGAHFSPTVSTPVTFTFNKIDVIPSTSCSDENALQSTFLFFQFMHRFMFVLCLASHLFLQRARPAASIISIYNFFLYLFMGSCSSSGFKFLSRDMTVDCARPT